MNSNLIHNILNLLIIVVTAVIGFDWSSIVPPEIALKVVGGLTLIKLTMNGFRDGLVGMVKPQPPVQ